MDQRKGKLPEMEVQIRAVLIRGARRSSAYRNPNAREGGPYDASEFGRAESSKASSPYGPRQRPEQPL